MAERVYISGPMTGLPDYNRPAFNQAADYFRSRGYLVENPGAVRIENGTWEQYLRVDIGMLLRCDMMVLLPGWWGSRGVKLELYIARSLGIPVFDYPSMRANTHDISASVMHDFGTYASLKGW